MPLDEAQPLGTIQPLSMYNPGRLLDSTSSKARRSSLEAHQQRAPMCCARPTIDVEFC